MSIQIAAARAQGETRAASGEVAARIREGLGGTSPELVLVFASKPHSLGQVLQQIGLQFPGTVVAGASTAGEFHGASEGAGSVVAWAIGGPGVSARGGLGDTLSSNPEQAVRQALPSLPPDPQRPHRTALVLVEPLGGHAEEVVDLCARELGDQVILAGGASGDDFSFQSTEVGLGSRSSRDGVVVVLLDTEKAPSVGVNHGHIPITAPKVVTRAEGATVYELDGKPAFQVWKEAVRSRLERTGVDIDQCTPEQVGEQLIRYQFNLPVASGMDRIRASLSVGPQDSLNFACGIEEGVSMRIMESSVSNQYLSAREAAFRAKRGLRGSPLAGSLVFDCACRKLIMGDEFTRALTGIQEVLGDAPMAGFETYGEIARAPGEEAIFHHTTTVVLVFPA